jgi:hypothetical protein
MFSNSKEDHMRNRSRRQAIGAAVVSLAVLAAGCGSESGQLPTGPSEDLSPGRIAMYPAGAIVGTSVVLESNIAREPRDPREPWHYRSDLGADSMYYSWDFGDGTTASGSSSSMSHVYTREGTFFASVTATSSESGSQQATANIDVGSLTGTWSGDFGRVSITQEGLQLRGRYLDDPREGTVEGGISAYGTVTFTVTRPGLEPLTFTGTAGAGVMTLVGKTKGRDAVDRPSNLTRD